MDFIKGQLFLDKINREMSRMQASPGQVAQIDIDILKNYIRELYDVCNDDTMAHQYGSRTEKVTTPVGPKTIPVVEDVKKPEPVRFSPERTTVASKPAEPVRITEAVKTPVVETPRVVEQPRLVEQPKPVEKALEPVVVREVVQEPEPAPQPKPEPIRSSGSVPKKIAALFVLPVAKEISEKLARSPLSDVKLGMTLNDRLQWPTALFGGNKALFETAVERVNNASSFEDAKNYLLEFAEQYNWADSHTEDVAHDFVILVGRRFGM